MNIYLAMGLATLSLCIPLTILKIRNAIEKKQIKNIRGYLWFTLAAWATANGRASVVRKQEKQSGYDKVSELAKVGGMSCNAK